MSTRYYNPALGRFINADAFAATGQGILGNNMFCYCENNPVMTCDPSGNIRVSILEKELFHVPVTTPIPADSPEDQVYGVVNGQDLLSYADERIGLGSYGKSGCAYIAAYNALQLVGKGKPLSVVTNEIYHDYGSVLFGAFGVAPATLAVYLRDQGIVSVESANLNTLVNGITDGSVITFTAWNNSNNPLSGWHAMTALYTNEEYLLFNRYDRDSKPRNYSSLSTAIGGGEFLYGVRIDPQ